MPRSCVQVPTLTSFCDGLISCKVKHTLSSPGYFWSLCFITAIEILTKTATLRLKILGNLIQPGVGNVNTSHLKISASWTLCVLVLSRTCCVLEKHPRVFFSVALAYVPKYYGIWLIGCHGYESVDTKNWLCSFGRYGQWWVMLHGYNTQLFVFFLSQEWT